AALHVYRTYVEPQENRVAPEDTTANLVLPQDLRDVLELRGERSPQRDEFVTRWQQTTGPVMAKGVEDTTFYRYCRLTALNEVGGDPGRFSLDPATFHARAQARHERHPLWLLASQTHDTKRAGDVRARSGGRARVARRAVPAPHLARRARPLPGRRVLVAEPRRSRQPPPDRLGTALPRTRSGDADARDDEVPSRPPRAARPCGACRCIR